MKMDGVENNEEMKTKGEAEAWAELMDSEGEQYTITDRTNDKIVFSS